MFATGGRYSALCLVLLLLAVACKPDKPVEQKKIERPAVVTKPRHPVLSAQQRQELGFPDDIISKIELAAGAEAEPFFSLVSVRSRNLKGEEGLEQEKLAGFSVRTKQSDDLIDSFRLRLRAEGFLIFKSHRGYGSLPDIVSIVKGSSSYDILRIQGTEAPNYHLDTKAIIAWLKEQQKAGTFLIMGAGPDWVEAHFVRKPANMRSFAGSVLAFAPDVRQSGPQTAESLAAQMKKTNSFLLVWD